MISGDSDPVVSTPKHRPQRNQPELRQTLASPGVAGSHRTLAPMGRLSVWVGDTFRQSMGAAPEFWRDIDPASQRQGDPL